MQQLQAIQRAMGRDEEAAQAFEAGEPEAEVELRGSIAVLQKRVRRCRKLRQYAYEVACTLAADASDEVLKLINEESLTSPSTAALSDPEILAEDPKGPTSSRSRWPLQITSRSTYCAFWPQTGPRSWRPVRRDAVV
jgi:hypothetical protein